MYIMDTHNHAKWLAKKKNEAEAWKEHQKEINSASNKYKASFKTAPNTDSNAEKRRKNSKLALAKRFKSALVTNVQLSDPEVQDILDTAMVNANKYYNDNSEYE